MFLVVDMTIQNQGYQTFSVERLLFKVTISAVSYNYAILASAILGDDGFTLLEDANLSNGGSLTGSLAFEVPAQHGQAIPSYEARRSLLGVQYNVQWMATPRPIGLPPNIVLTDSFGEVFPQCGYLKSNTTQLAMSATLVNKGGAGNANIGFYMNGTLVHAAGYFVAANSILQSISYTATLNLCTSFASTGLGGTTTFAIVLVSENPP